MISSLRAPRPRRHRAPPACQTRLMRPVSRGIGPDGGTENQSRLRSLMTLSRWTTTRARAPAANCPKQHTVASDFDFGDFGLPETCL